MIGFIGRRWAMCCLLTFTFSFGCGGSNGGMEGEGGKVLGKVTVQGVPPAAGTTISYTGSDGKAVSTPVDADGSYLIASLPVGDAKIVVVGHVGMHGMPGSEKGAAVPTKYAKAGAIPSFLVKKGPNKNDIDLSR